MEKSRVPHGARGLKPTDYLARQAAFGRVPHGARGLKLIPLAFDAPNGLSRPARGAWIETGTGKVIKR